MAGGAHEALEHARAVDGGNTGAIVDHFQQRVAPPRFRLGADSDFCLLACIVQCIVDQIAQRFAQQRRIGIHQHGRYRSGFGHAQIGTAAQGTRHHLRYQFLHQPGQIDFAALQGGAGARFGTGQ